MKINLKDIDYKQFLLEKGERIGLYVAVGLMALFLVLGLGIKGLGSGSPSANADKLSDLTKKGEQAIRDSKPNPKDGEIDPDLKKAANPTDINPQVFACSHPLFHPFAQDDNKWRRPEILAPDEFQYEVVSGLIEAYGLSDDGETIIVLTTKDPDKTGQLNKDKVADIKKKLNERRRFAQNRPGTRQPGGGGPARPGGGASPSQVGLGGMTGAMQGNQDGGKQEYELTPVPTKELSEKSGAKLAQIPLPYRIAVVSGAFPYRQQMEEFRRALRFPTMKQMLDDQDATIEFLDLEIERREVIDGKPGEWKPLDVEALKKLMAKAVGKEPENPLLKGAAFPVNPTRLIMRRPKFARADQKYPELVPASVKETLEALNTGKAAAVNAPKRANKFQEDPNLYGDDEDDKGKDGPAKQPNATRPENIQPGEIGDKPGATLSQEAALPEKCLVRFLDVTVEPGKVYEYRLRVKMANPNYQKADRAVTPHLAEIKELEGPWKEISKKVTVTPQTYYYAVDERPENQRGRMELANQDRAALQVHRWLERVRTNPTNNNSEINVGDWAILERILVYRGEYIGRTERVDVPWWNPVKETFVLASPPDEVKPKGARPTSRAQPKSGVPVDFNTEAILLDFEGGKRLYNVGTKSINDEGPTEVLVMDQEGKTLLVRNGKADSEDPERRKRLEGWQAWLKKVKEAPEDGKEKKVGPNIFDNPKPPK
jgi:hypothetical protein